MLAKHSSNTVSLFGAIPQNTIDFYKCSHLIICSCSFILPAAQCPPLPEIANGMISYLPDNTSDYDVGTMAIYVCEDGFTLSRDETRDCQSDGTFSGMEPVCSMTRKI